MPCGRGSAAGSWRVRSQAEPGNEGEDSRLENERSERATGHTPLYLLLDRGEVFTKQEGMSLRCSVHPYEEGTERKKETNKHENRDRLRHPC